MKKKKNNIQVLVESDKSSDSFEEELNYQIQEKLKASINEMKGFLSSLGDLQKTPLLEWVLKYCTKIVPGNLSTEEVLKITDRRVQKMMKNKRVKRNWGKDDSKILIWIVSKYCQLNKIYRLDDMSLLNWEFISDLIPGSTANGCFFKWLTLKKVKLSDCKWSQEQSDLLQRLVENSEIREWKQIAQDLYIQNKNKKKKFRSPKQCREHWLSFLDPSKKTGLWSKQEDIKLFGSVMENRGQKKWSEIRKKFDGRTENAMKNRYNLLIDKQKKLLNDEKELRLVYEVLKQLGSKKLSKYRKILTQVNGEKQMYDDEVSLMIQSEMQDDEQHHLPERIKKKIDEDENEVSVKQSKELSEEKIITKTQMKTPVPQEESRPPKEMSHHEILKCLIAGQLKPVFYDENMRMHFVSIEDI